MNELVRKAIHVSGILYIPIYSFLGKDNIIILLLILIPISFVFELLRIRRGLLTRIFREYERRRFASYFYYLIAIFLVTIFFSREACFSAVVCSNIGDFVAGIVRKWKDFFSSIFMFLSSTLFLFFIGLGLSSIFSAAAATLVERLRRFDDNFTVPIFAALVTEISLNFKIFINIILNYILSVSS
ncbi:MAG: hypothetical protein NZ895_04580 [Archaeoglobaceae archaeon]|nr:hypothetical protein [Archaeoglobaceae archaeon]MCX8152614.1 hypothetical protein [Archaeoglobaceae archaeon]MDW8014104.1 hypothetical protein [Archaeoglobaceae archaeon]